MIFETLLHKYGEMMMDKQRLHVSNENKAFEILQDSADMTN